MNRRGFLASCLALAAAPAIVRADSLMRIVPKRAAVLGIGGIAAGDRISIEGIAGIFRVTSAYDLRTDSHITRLDSWNGVTQVCVDTVIDGPIIASKGGVIPVEVMPALRVLVDQIERDHGSLDGFRAPPVYGGDEQWVIK